MYKKHAQPNLLSYIDRRSRNLNAYSKNEWNSRMFCVPNQYYNTDLKAHFGCVNAIEFSRNDLLLASGGDDRRILLWNVSEAMTTLPTHKVPNKMDSEHNSNIFCLAFNATDELIISGGNDGCIIVHDLSSGKPSNTYLTEESIYCISADPIHEFMFVAASHEGSALVYDVRSNSETLTLGQPGDPVQSVQYNPVAPRYLATITNKSTAKLWDIRHPSKPVVSYRCYKDTNSKYCGMGVSFNSKGDKLLVIGRLFAPYVYDITNPDPIHEFSADGYFSSCTIKSCCWTGPDSQYVTTGSDDFNVYMWELPEEATPDNYLVESPSKVLTGHRSIVNQVRYNDEYSLVATSGVEKVIKMWSPFAIYHSDDRHVMSSERNVYTTEEYRRLFSSPGAFMSHNYADESMEEDSKMMALFDTLVQRQLRRALDSTDEDDSPSDVSEEASQRRYNYELSTSSSSSDVSSTQRRSRRLNILSSSEESTLDGPSMSSLSPTLSADTMHPGGTATMSEIVRINLKQTELRRSLAMVKKRLNRQQRKSDIIESRGLASDSEDSNSDSGLTASQRRKGKRRREKVKRILSRIGINEVRSQTGQADQTEPQTSTFISTASPYTTEMVPQPELNDRLEELRQSWTHTESAPGTRHNLPNLKLVEEETFGERSNVGSCDIGSTSTNSLDRPNYKEHSLGTPTSTSASESAQKPLTPLFKSRLNKNKTNIKKRTQRSSDSDG